MDTLARAEKDAPQTQQHLAGAPNERLGMWVFLSSEIILFGGLLGSCVLFRLSYEQWREYAAHVNWLLGSLNTFILITSSLTIVLAHRAASNDNYSAVRWYLFLTIIMGLAFLGNKAIEYSHEIHNGYTLTKGPFWMFYYGITGLHGLHVLAGVIINSIVFYLVLEGRKCIHFIENAGLYWHFVDIVWIFVFPLFYLS